MTVRESANGRRRYRSRQEADELAAEFEASGLTRREFCERRDVALNTLWRYVKRYREQAEESDARPRWVAVEIAAPGSTGSGVSVLVGAGRRVDVERGFDPGTLRQVVVALESL